jgi:hypothetical protein
MYERMRRRQTAKVRLKTKLSIFQNKITTKQNLKKAKTKSKKNHSKISTVLFILGVLLSFCCGLF